MKILITTEATADFPDSLLREDVKIIPMGYTVNGVGYDGVNEVLTPHEFYEAVSQAKTASDLPQTSQVTEYVAEEFFSKYLEEGYDIIHVGFDSALSGTIEQERMAVKACQEKYPDRKITVFDSLCATFGQGLLVYHLLQAKDNGASYDELVKLGESLKNNVVHIFAIDDLNHLCRTGRATKNEAFIGTALHIKPILYIPDDGKLIPFTKVMSQKKAIKTLYDTFMRTALDPSKNTIVGVGAADSDEDREFLAKLIQDAGYKTVYFDIGPIIGTHVGKGMICLIYLAEDRKHIV